MKFTMYENESKDEKYRNNPYRASNFDIDGEGHMVCPNGKRFYFLRKAPVKGNQYGRTEEYITSAKIVKDVPTERNVIRAARTELCGSIKN